MLRHVLASLLLLTLCCLASAGDAPDAAPAPAPGSAAFFTERVRPLLEDRCLECHGDIKHKADLKLNDRSAALAGGTNGPAVIIGDPDHSPLILRVRARGTDDVMPPVDPPLNDAQIADLTAWVAAGATWVHADGSVEQGTAAVAPAKHELRPLIGRVHPLIVHFPIACLLLALLAEFLFLTRGPDWGPTVGLLLAVGIAGAVVAVISGTWFAEDGSMFQRHDRGLRLHEVAGWLTLVLSLASGALLLASRSTPRARLYFRLLLLITAVVTGVTGHLGGAMVYPDLGLF